MFDDETREAAAANTTGFGDAFAGRGESINTAIGAFRPLLRNIIPVAQNLSSPDTNLRRFVRRAGRRRGDRGARRRDAGRAVRQPRHDVRARCARSPGRTSRTRSPAAARRSTPRSARSRSSGRSCATPKGLFRELRPGAAALRTSAPTIADALVEGTRVLPRTPPFNRRLLSLLEELQTFAEDPMVPRGLRATTGGAALARPDAGVPHARADGLQLRDAVVPQRRLAAQRGRPQRHLAALHHHRHAAGAEQRGRPVERAGRRPDRGQPPPHEPVPEHARRPASRASARPATSRTSAVRR